MIGTTQENLREQICIDKQRSIRKITIVGVGQVGTACAYSIMQQVMPLGEVNLSITFTSKGKREFVPRDQVSSLFVVY